MVHFKIHFDLIYCTDWGAVHVNLENNRVFKKKKKRKVLKGNFGNFRNTGGLVAHNGGVHYSQGFPETYYHPYGLNSSS